MSLRSQMEFAGFLVARALVRVIPTRLLHALGAWIARLAFAAGGKHVGYALVNLRIAFPDLSEYRRREIGRLSYENLARNIIDVLRFDTWSEEDIRARVEITGLRHLDAARAQGKGVLVLTLHLGNFELALMALGLTGVPVSAVARKLPNSFLYARIAAWRRRSGAELIDHKKSALKILRGLREGRAIGLLIDRYSRRDRGVFVPLFGVRCSTSAGLATLALRAGAPVIPVYILRDGPDHHQIVILPALEFRPSGDRKRDIEVLTARCNEVLEELIRRHPEQWIWAHRRFRNSPDVPESVYATRTRIPWEDIP